MAYNFYVIGIGSSAGGLDPLLSILQGLSPDINAAIVVVQHMPADAFSRLDVIVSRVTNLNVEVIETGEQLQPGHVYVMASGKELALQNGKLSVKDRTPGEKINRTIDNFFLTLADEVRDKCIGIILSGAGFDGIEGAKAIEANHGLVIVQDPGTAQFPLMPENLIANDHPDYVLKPEDIQRKIEEKVGGYQ